MTIENGIWNGMSWFLWLPEYYHQMVMTRLEKKDFTGIAQSCIAGVTLTFFNTAR
jgi:hypothetical protein